MASVHLKCQRERNLHTVAHPIYDSGYWDFTPEEAAQLVGGTLYLHETKAERSYFGGTVLSYEVVNVPEKAHSQRIMFRIRSTAEAKNKAWRGANHGRAWTGGILP
ncbi:hypothetical protein [Corallococcus sp. RDP092CA]|uniref:hypothetical protein n=1 Tax=Corallococcus sp. RDP092CA TaxID=3109369 RepID=UPI0035AD7A08